MRYFPTLSKKKMYNPNITNRVSVLYYYITFLLFLDLNLNENLKSTELSYIFFDIKCPINRNFQRILHSSNNFTQSNHVNTKSLKRSGNLRSRIGLVRTESSFPVLLTGSLFPPMSTSDVVTSSTFGVSARS